MGRARAKTKKAVTVSETNVSTSSAKPPPTVPELLEKAQSLIVQCDYDLAGRFVHRILEHEPHHPQAREMLGVIQLETGDVESAKQTFLSLLPPNPNAPSPSPPHAHLYVAQLSDDDPQLALQHYQSAVDILLGRLKGKDRAIGGGVTDAEETELKNIAVRALISMVEIWMDPSYDLCFDPAAENNCEGLLDLAMQIDPNNTEALQSLASVRMSQQRPDEAKEILERAWVKWKDLELDDTRVPSIQTRLSIVRLFLELSLFPPALQVLQGIMSTDDQEVEAWYLEGWCFFLMAEQAKESGTTVEELTWGDLARDAMDCLEACSAFHIQQDHPDRPLLEHTKELMAKLDALGIKPRPDDEDEEGMDDGDWDDTEGSEDDDGDVEMA